VSTDPKAIRARMAKTRSALERKLGELKSRFSLSPASEKRTKPMATKKSSGGTMTKKKATAKAGKAMKTVKKTAGKYATKAKKVLGDMLAGAAVGAVKGAAEAVETDTKGKKRGGKQ
jgi:hypothetical protein